MDKHFTVDISSGRFSNFSFIIVPTTHLHMRGFALEESEASDVKKKDVLRIKRLEALLEKPPLFEKNGIAHLHP